jgi:hypothetical protein
MRVGRIDSVRAADHIDYYRQFRARDAVEGAPDGSGSHQGDRSHDLRGVI